jgi:hypothetical protein
MAASDRPATAELVTLGLLGGAAYTADFGIGPHLLLISLGVARWRYANLSAVAIVAAAAAPLVILHHALNFAIGGTLAPASTIPEYFAWPGSIFDATSLTGRWNHPTMEAALRYGFELLFGKHGFVFHNTPLLLAAPALAIVWHRRQTMEEWPTVVGACAFVATTWVTYAALSTNFAGVSASIRWFVPWLAPVYFVLCVWLHTVRQAWIPFAALSGIGAIIIFSMWPKGPWMRVDVPLYSVWAAVAVSIVIVWAIVAFSREWFRRGSPGLR